MGLKDILIAGTIIGASTLAGCSICQHDQKHLDLLEAQKSNMETLQDKAVLDELIRCNTDGNYIVAAKLINDYLKQNPKHPFAYLFNAEAGMAEYNLADEQRIMHMDETDCNDGYMGAVFNLERAENNLEKALKEMPSGNTREFYESSLRRIRFQRATMHSNNKNYGFCW